MFSSIHNSYSYVGENALRAHVVQGLTLEAWSPITRGYIPCSVGFVILLRSRGLVHRVRTSPMGGVS